LIYLKIFFILILSGLTVTAPAKAICHTYNVKLN